MTSPSPQDLPLPRGATAARGRLGTALALLLPVAAGAINVFAFAPFKLWPLQVLALAWLFHGVLAQPQASTGRHFVRGWLYGIGWAAGRCGGPFSGLVT